MNSKNKLLIYGAAGYTGRLVSERAKELGLPFEIAGRAGDSIEAFAGELGVPCHIFTVDDAAGWKTALKDGSCLINVAGPFHNTAEYAMRACIENGVHHLDISAELPTYQLAESLDKEAKKAGIMLISGAGIFVSYDALVLHTASRVKNPQSLSVAFRHFGGFSRGSVKSSRNIVDLGVMIRQDGRIKQVLEPKTKVFDFGDGEEACLPTPLGGIILCYKSTGIPNIMEYFQLKLPAAGMANLEDIETLPDGPNAEERAAGRTKLAAEVIGEDGDKAYSVVDGPSGYSLTPLSVVAVANRILNGNFKTGFQSPASAFGEAIIDDIPDTKINDF